MLQLGRIVLVLFGLLVLAFRTSRWETFANQSHPPAHGKPHLSTPPSASAPANALTGIPQGLFAAVVAVGFVVRSSRSRGRTVRRALWVDKSVAPDPEHKSLMPRGGPSFRAGLSLQETIVYYPKPARMVDLTTPAHLVKTTAEMQRNKIWAMPETIQPLMKKATFIFKDKDDFNVTRNLVVVKGACANKMLTQATKVIEQGTPKHIRLLRMYRDANPNWARDVFRELSRSGMRAMRSRSGMRDNRLDPHPKYHWWSDPHKRLPDFRRKRNRDRGTRTKKESFIKSGRFREVRGK